MRQELEKRDGERTTFRGTFARFGSKRGWKGDLPTVLFQDIRTPTGEPICDHLWMNLTKGIVALDLQIGDVVQFDARVLEYEKGYKGRRDDVYDAPISIDYKLSHPTRLVKVAP